MTEKKFDSRHPTTHEATVASAPVPVVAPEPVKKAPMFVELDTLTSQARKNALAQDEAESRVNELAVELANSKGDLTQEKVLADHIKDLVDLLSTNDYRTHIVEWTKVLATSEHTLKAATNKTPVAAPVEK